MVFRARDEQVARTTLKEGHALLMAAINDARFDVQAAVARLRDIIDDATSAPAPQLLWPPPPTAAFRTSA